MTTAAPSPKPLDTFAVGDVVEFTDSESKETVRALVVKKATTKGRVTVSNGYIGYLVPVPMLRKVTDVRVPAAGPMANYCVKKYKHIERLSEETNCFTCDIARVSDGYTIAFVSNRGTGGPDQVDANTRVLGSFAREARDLFCRQAEEWTKWAGIWPDQYTEHVSLWMEWERIHRPMGASAADFIAAYLKELKSFG